MAADDITDLILDDHDRFRRMFLALEEVSEPDELHRRWSELSALLELHASAEEAVFYPHLLRRGTDAEDETEDAVGDHNDIRAGIRAAEGAEVGSDDWWTAVRRTRDENSHHLHEEETEALPDFRANSPADLRADLAGQWHRFRTEHPGARGLSGRDKDPDDYIEASRPSD